MRRYEMICVGAGPAGLAAAIEAAKYGVQVIVFDENDRPGGQLFKQIHKFFGSQEHRAKERGFNIPIAWLLRCSQMLSMLVEIQDTDKTLTRNRPDRSLPPGRY